MELTPTEARRLRLRAQGLDQPLELDPAGVVARGVAFQGQDLPGVLQAIALRSRAGTSVDDVRAAFDAGALVRGWTQRGTLFATTPAAHARLLGLTAAVMKRTLPKRREFLGITAPQFELAERVAREQLASGGRTRAELLAAWEAAGVSTAGQRGYHFIASLAYDGIMHWGPFRGRDQELVATLEREPGDAVVDLVEIARGYLRAHGPVQCDELAWWMGLPKTPIRAALRDLADELVEASIEGAAYVLLAETLDDGPPGEVDVRLVPSFDEIYLGYQFRELIASPATQAAIVPGGNGIFRPAILVDGYVVGTWRRAAKKGEEPVELTERVSAATRRRIDDAVSAWRL